MALKAMSPEPPPRDAPPERFGVSTPDTLSKIRQEIDRLDDQIHDLIVARADLVTRLAKSGAKQGIPYRPAREAQILRRLLKRHRGPLPAGALMGIWREILSSMRLIQAPMSVAVWSADHAPQYLALTRDHFGAGVRVRALQSSAQVLAAVETGQMSLGVLPVPGDTAAAEPTEVPWWLRFLRGDAHDLSIVARLPLLTAWAEAPSKVAAFVVARLVPEPSGNDDSLVAFECSPSLDDTAIGNLVSDAGFQLRSLVVYRGEPPAVACLAEVAGHVSAAAPRLSDLARRGASRPSVLGAWPVVSVGLAGSVPTEDSPR